MSRQRCEHGYADIEGICPHGCRRAKRRVDKAPRRTKALAEASAADAAAMSAAMHERDGESWTTIRLAYELGIGPMRAAQVAAALFHNGTCTRTRKAPGAPYVYRLAGGSDAS